MKPKRPYKYKTRYFSSTRKTFLSGNAEFGLFTKTGRVYYIEYNDLWDKPREFKGNQLSDYNIKEWTDKSYYTWTEITKEEYEQTLFTLCL